MLNETVYVYNECICITDINECMYMYEYVYNTYFFS